MRCSPITVAKSRGSVKADEQGRPAAPRPVCLPPGDTLYPSNVEGSGERSVHTHTVRAPVAQTLLRIHITKFLTDN